MKRTNKDRSMYRVAAIAPWYHLCLPSCGPRFESQAIYRCFFQFVLLKFYRENNENKQKEAGIGPFYKIGVWKEVKMIKRYFRALNIGYWRSIWILGTFSLSRYLDKKSPFTRASLVPFCAISMCFVHFKFLQIATWKFRRNLCTNYLWQKSSKYLLKGKKISRKCFKSSFVRSVRGENQDRRKLKSSKEEKTKDTFNFLNKYT